MAKSFAKKNKSSMQVIKTLKVLLEDNYTMQELIKRLNKEEKEPIFNNNVISKYINTCRYCGIDIPKIQNRYIVASMPFGMELSNSELDLFYMLQEKAKEILSTKTAIKFENLLSKISKFSNKHIVRVDKKTANITIENFEKAITEKRKINLMLKTKTNIKCMPKCFSNKENKLFFNVLINGIEKTISTDRVIGLEILDEKFQLKFSEKEVVYKLTGGLAKRYSLRENEVLTEDKLPEYIVVTNKGEPQEDLLSRLMRYDKNCEVVSPVEYKEAMIDMINKTLENYGVEA